MKKKIHIKTIGGEKTVKDEMQKDKLNEGKKVLPKSTDATKVKAIAIRRKSKRRKKLPSVTSIAMQNLFFSPTPLDEQRRTGRRLILKNSSPHLYIIKNFLSNAEIAHLDSKYITPNFSKFARSYTDDGSVGSDKTYNDNRTSTFMWLQKAGDTTLRNIERRAAEIVGLPSFNVEPFQIVAYKNGQEFKTHHDMGELMEDGTVQAGEPRRLVTFFVYLNTLPFGQGHTEFPSLNHLSITPERGMALMFPNILSDGMPDKLTIHKANPVIDPYIKFGMNIWITSSNLQDYIGINPTKNSNRNNKIKKKRKISTSKEDTTRKKEKKLGILESLNIIS